MKDIRQIDSPERMIDAIRHFGLIPFFKGAVPGWSIEELTAPGCWFTDSDEFGGTLGPWDWKIECVREGDIAYGKFLGGKAAFATVGYYRHLMNWRRSLPKYRMALGEKYEARTKGEKLMKTLSPIALAAIREAGALESGQVRAICAEMAPDIDVRKNVADSVMQFLQMGTWSVIGDFRRVYRGPELTYCGWQKASNTTPDELFNARGAAETCMPAWARRFEEQTGGNGLDVDCPPDESRELLMAHVMEMFPEADRKKLEKLIW